MKDAHERRGGVESVCGRVEKRISVCRVNVGGEAIDAMGTATRRCVANTDDGCDFGRGAASTVNVICVVGMVQGVGHATVVNVL